MKSCSECYNMRGKMPEKIEDGVKVLDYQNHTVTCKKGYLKFTETPEKDRTFKHSVFKRSHNRYYDLWRLAETCVDYNIDTSFNWLKEANHV